MLRYGMLAVAAGLFLAFPGLAQERARVVRITPLYDVVQGGKKGINVQLDSEIDGLQGRPVLIRAMYYSVTGQPLLAKPGPFSTPDGFVSAAVAGVPLLPMSNVQNTIFIPYEELNLVPGVHQLSFRIQIYHLDGWNWRLLDETRPMPFQLARQ
jgi:hypothetical protein